ncbi:MAG TPA: DNA topoisomerase VI subunit B [Candidatus Nanoarchaeia archaeon]|nr:DNA topoisomerase VI subunit B [Candidatus Nanoarchaeia archaeon]
MVSVAEEISKTIKQSSIAEFFEKNRHLLGFDSKLKALITCIKEAVDNSLDACEEMVNAHKRKKLDYSLPEIIVSVRDNGNEHFVIKIIDNGPGIVKNQLPNVFTRLLYGSKFHQLKQGRGQQGIGISAAVLYAQLSTGKATHVVSKIGSDQPAYFYDLRIDTINNKPEIVGEGVLERFQYEHGTEVELEIEGTYQTTGEKSVYEYLRRTSIVNPHVKIIFYTPDGKKVDFPRITEEMPKESVSIKPHPYGIEIGTFIKMAAITSSYNVKSFMMNDFSRMGATTVDAILKEAGIEGRYKPSELSRDQCEKIVKIIQKTKIMNPPTDCLSPIGDEALRKSLRTGLDTEFVTTISRPPSVYRGNPFLIEAAIAYGGSLPSEGAVDVIRFANKVPLQYSGGACAITEMVKSIDWRRYGLNQSGGAGIPSGQAIILVHMASVWIPFTSESKAAIAHYDAIMKEMKLALQDCGRELGKYLNKKQKALRQQQRISTFVRYADESIQSLFELTGEKKEVIKELFEKVINERIGSIKDEADDVDEEQKVDNMDDVDKFKIKEEGMNNEGNEEN